jgi:hypothetical protein
MTENSMQVGAHSSFTFEWGAVRLELSGGEELIREAFTLLRQEIMPKLGSAPSRADTETPSSPNREPNVEVVEETTRGSSGDPSPAEFYRQKKPKTDQERATVLSFYLKEYRGITEFTVSDLERLYNEAHAPIKNVQNAVWNSGRKGTGWIKVVPGKRSVYSLTPAGESYVRTQLPKA